MNSERWRHIEAVRRTAAARPPAERAAFLADACAGDEDLLREVEALLSRAAPADTEGDASALRPGQRVGAYELQATIGAGGMGVVYRARDTRLNRTVAIKVLAAGVADANARRRFQREAQTASSLNHPHILTVHDVGEFDGRQYLVTEFVEGGTLRTWMQAGRREWRDGVELLAGVADGLAAAHEAGILHRDLKPENILIASNAYAKLADFGLAKLAEDGPPGAAVTRTASPTQAGAIIGTVAYMSPEQALGQPVDCRSDIFSFGIVLHEVLAGRRPFTAATDVETLWAIIHQAPPPLPESVPASLREMVGHALEKTPANRFQSMRTMADDLRRVLRRGAEPAPSPVRPSGRTRAWLWAAATVTAALLAALAARAGWLAPRAPSATPGPYAQLTSFTDSATSPALSPDGRMLAFIRGASTFTGPGQIYVKLLPDGDPVQLTKDDLEKMGPAFSPDGARIAYTGIDSAAFATMDTWVVPALGGPSRRLLTNAEGLTWTRRQGTDPPRVPTVLFSVMTGRVAQMSIVSSTESRAGLRTVYEPPPPDGMAHRSVQSPDGQWVLVVEMDIRSWLPCRLLPFDGSTSGTLVGPVAAQCTDAAWSPDGAWMYFTATTASGIHIWRQRFPNGTPEQVTFGVTTEEGIAFARDGRSFVTSIGTSQSSVWLRSAGGERQMTSEGFAFLPSLSPDGRKLYCLVRSYGIRSWYQGGLWVVDTETAERQRLLPDFQMLHYTISQDGQRVVYVAVDEEGRSAVWLAPLDGRTPPRQLTTVGAVVAFFGAPGEVLFADQKEGAVYRVRETGGSVQKAIAGPGTVPTAVSPDGQWVAVQDPNAFGAVVVYPVAGGPAVRVCERCSRPQGTEWIPSPLQWTPDGRFLYLRFSGSTYAIPLTPGQMLPRIPPGGFPSRDAVAASAGARLIGDAGELYPGPDPSVQAVLKVSTQRNLYRVPVF